MRKLIVAAAAMAAFAIADTASADPVRVGFGGDVGVPSGVATGVVVNPGLDWVRVQASVTWNYLSFGGRGSVQLDPMALIPVRHQARDQDGIPIFVRGEPAYVYRRDFPVGIFADVQAGFQPSATIPGHSDLPAVGFDYVSLYGGLRLGNPNGFHWNFELGPTYLHVYTKNFQSVVSHTGTSGLKLGNPSVDGWLVPTLETGFTVVFP